MQIPDGLQYWEIDQVAECMDGIGMEMYRRLWELLETVPPIPVGGDGSNGTIETPLEPDAYLGSKMSGIWSKLTDSEQEHIASCYAKYESRYQIR